MSPLPLVEPDMQISSIRLTDAGRRDAVRASVGCARTVPWLLASRPRVVQTEEGLSEMHIIPLPCRSPRTQVAASLPIRPICEVRPLRSTGVTPLPRYYEPVRLPTAADAQLWFPTRRCAATHRRAPRRVSQDPRPLCRRAPSPPPRAAPRVPLLVASPRMAGFPQSGRLAAAIGVTRPSRVRLRWAHVFAFAGGCSPLARPRRTDRSVSRRQLPFDARPTLHAERAIHMADSFQSARVARVGLAQPDLRGLSAD